jgi:hypothetical protein
LEIDGRRDTGRVQLLNVSSRGEPWPSGRWGPAAGFTIGVLGIAILAALVRPFQAGSIAFDGTAAVLYFERIISGQRLEAFVNTTPKPLLTAVFGVAHGLTGDWRTITWATIVVTAAAAIMGAGLAWRLAGPLAAVVAAAFVVLDGNLVVEVAWSHGLPWALATWFAAGLALTAARPRYAIAGVALLIGCLARQETFLLLAVASGLTVWNVARHAVGRGALMILIGWLAVVVFLVHDQLLTGDPLFWLRVASINALGTTPRSLGTVARMVLGAFIGNPVLLVVSVIGLWTLRTTNGGRIVAIGILAVSVGTALLLLLLAMMSRNTLFYYLHPIAVSLGYAAAFGVASIGRWFADRFRMRASAERPADARADRLPAAIGLAAAAVVVLVAFVPVLVSPSTMTTLRQLRTSAVNAQAALPMLQDLAAWDMPIPTAPGAEKRADPAGFRLLVSHANQLRLAVDLGLPVTVVGPLDGGPAVNDRLQPVQVVYHDETMDGSRQPLDQFQATSPVQVAGIDYELVRHGPGNTWIWRSTDWPTPKVP